MSIGFVIRLMREALFNTLIFASPILITGMVVGLIVGIFQTTTSIQEQTLSFVPKIIAIMLSIIIFIPLIVQGLVIYAKRLFMEIANF